MTTLRALDLFCGAGGASMGLHRAGFDVTGIDINPQPRYPFRFAQANALEPPFDLSKFDFIWASPPCQHYTIVWRGQEDRRKNYPDLIEATRNLLAGHPCTVIENVPKAPLRPDLVLTGAQFGLDIVRNRVFEINGFDPGFQLVRQQSKKVSNGGLACVAGHGANSAWNLRRSAGLCKWRDLPKHLTDALNARNCVSGWRSAMGIDWMTRDEIREAVPPAYSEFIGRAFIAGALT
jgi:DNA (cytosine-5)-methyltransferase 1